MLSCDTEQQLSVLRLVLCSHTCVCFRVTSLLVSLKIRNVHLSFFLRGEEIQAQSL